MPFWNPPHIALGASASGALFIFTLAKGLAGYFSLKSGLIKKCLQNRTLWLIVNSCERRIIPVGVTIHLVFINKRRGYLSIGLSNLFLLSHQADLVELSVLFFFEFFHSVKVYFLRYLRVIMPESGGNRLKVHSLGCKH